MRRFVLLLFIASFPAVVFAQARRAFTFEDMMAIKRVGAPIVSPGGKWVAFDAVDVDLAANTKTPHIWIIPAAGGQEREIISAQDAERPRWSPDGKHFAFISQKEGGSQVWIADFDGASGAVTGVHKLTSLATHAEGELWSPDGKNILFLSDVYPECDGAPAEEVTCNAKKLDEVQQSKVKALVFTRLLYRHWNAYKEGKRSHIFVVSADASAVPRDVTPGDYDAPVFSMDGPDDYAFSPDGKEICYASNHEKNEAASTNNDLWIVPVEGGRASSPVAKNITADNPASDSSPLYSPDGKYIAYRAQVRAGYESDRFRLMLYDRKTGEKKNLTEGFDRWVGTFVWTTDSQFIYFVAEDKGESPVYALTLFPDKAPRSNRPPCAPCTSSITEMWRGFNDDLMVAQNGRLLFTQMSLKAPNEILVSVSFEVCNGQQPHCVEGMNPAPLTHLNDSAISRVFMSPLEPFWFTGAHGDEVEGFLVKPPNFDATKKYPVKFLIHGGPQGAWGDDWSYRWNPELFAANGYVVVMINFHGSTGYGQKFIDAVNRDWGGAPYEDLMKGLDYAEQTYSFLDKDRECALGASFGGYMTNWILGHTDRFKCIVTHDGTFNTESDWGSTEEIWFDDWELGGPVYDNRELYRKWSPHLSARNFKTPTLVVHGQLDYRLDVSEGFQLFTTLQMLGVPSKMLYFPDEGHWVLQPQNSQLWYKTVNDWVDQWLKK